MSKVIVISGADGVLCGALKALAKEGHKIAVLDLRNRKIKRISRVERFGTWNF